MDEETKQAYNAALDAAIRLADTFGDDPDDSLDWVIAGDGYTYCDGFTPAQLDLIRDLQVALRPFIFSDIRRA